VDNGHSPTAPVNSQLSRHFGKNGSQNSEPNLGHRKTDKIVSPFKRLCVQLTLSCTLYFGQKHQMKVY
jgi:hypothetical protein